MTTGVTLIDKSRVLDALKVGIVHSSWGVRYKSPTPDVCGEYEYLATEEVELYNKVIQESEGVPSKFEYVLEHVLQRDYQLFFQRRATI